MNIQLLSFKPIQVIEIKEDNKKVLMYLLSTNIDVPLLFITDQLVLCDQNETLKYKLNNLLPNGIQDARCHIQQQYLVVQSQEYIKVLYLDNNELNVIHEGKNKYVFGVQFITINNQLYGQHDGVGILNVQTQQPLYSFTGQILNILQLDDKIWVLTENNIMCIDSNGQINYTQTLGINGETYNQLLYIIERQDEKYFILSTQSQLMIYQKKTYSDELIDLSKGYQISYQKNILTRNVVAIYILNITDTDTECSIKIAAVTQKGVVQFFIIKISDIDTIVEREQYENLEQTLRRETILYAGANYIITKTKLIHLNQH